jgi:tape measure domain-containing protein
MEERISIVVEERGSRTVKRNISGIGGSANTAARDVDGLKSGLRELKAVLIGVGIGAAAREVLSLANTYSNLQNRLRVVTDSTAELAAVNKELFDVSQRTRSSFEGSVELYSRVRLATRDLGISARQTIQFTESLNQAILLSGASGAEAQAGLIQLSQGLASGTLRGDELRSVLEQLPAVADVIAKSLGVTRGELRKLGEQGKITAKDILKAFQESRVELEERFGKMVPTLAQGFQVLKNAVLQYVGAIDQSSGFTASLAQLMIYLGKNIETVGKITIVLATALGTVLALQAIPAALKALRALAIAINTNPVGLFITLVTTATVAVLQFGDKVRLGAGGAATALDVLNEAASNVFTLLKEGFNAVSTLVNGAQIDFDGIDLRVMFMNFARGLDAINAYTRATFEAIYNVIINQLNQIGQAVADTLNGAIGLAEDFQTGLNVIGRKLSGKELDPSVLADFGVEFKPRFEATGRDFGQAFQDSFVETFGAGTYQKLADNFLAGADARAAARAAGSQTATDLSSLDAAGTDKTANTALNAGLSARAQILDKVTKALGREADALKLSGIEREVFTQKLAIEDDLRQALSKSSLGLTKEQINALSKLTDEEQKNLLGKIRANLVEEEQQKLGKAREALTGQLIRDLQSEGQGLNLVGAQRQAYGKILEAEAQLRQQLRDSDLELTEEQINNLAKLTDAEKESVNALVARNRQLQFQSEIITGALAQETDLVDRVNAYAEVVAKMGDDTLPRYNNALQQAQLDLINFKVSLGEGTFADGFIQSLDRMRNGVESFASKAGNTFGDFFGQIGNGFADTIGQAVFDVDNLGESLKAVARNAVSQLISSLIKLGLQFVANQVLTQTLGATATAVATGQAATVAAAWAPAAAGASLASFGANAAPAAAGITSTYALTQALSAIGAGFADGTGYVYGMGGGRGDRILAALSHGEGVVSAAGNAQNPGVVDAMNRGERVGKSVTNIFNFPPGTDVESFRRSQRQIDREMKARSERD